MVLGPLRHSHEITSVAWEPDGQRLATGSLDKTVKIWNATTGRELVTLRGHDGAVDFTRMGSGRPAGLGGPRWQREDLDLDPRSGVERVAGTRRAGDVGVLEPGRQAAGVGRRRRQDPDLGLRQTRRGTFHQGT